MQKSIFYKNPFLYKLGLRFIHRENLAKRYKFLASFAEKGDFVLEPACGPAILADFLPNECLYFGFDMNEDFINSARKKYPGVYRGNILNVDNYLTADLVISCDVLHHLEPGEREVFIENCWKATKKKLIFCEPAKGAEQSKFWFEYIERDGKNLPRLKDFWDEKTLKTQIENGFFKISPFYLRSLEKIGKDFIGVFSKDFRK